MSLQFLVSYVKLLIIDLVCPVRQRVFSSSFLDRILKIYYYTTTTLYSTISNF